MADATTHVIDYQADIRDVKTQLQELQRINASLATKLGQDFSNATKIINQSVDRIKIKRIIDPKTGAESTQVLGQLSTVFRDAGGNVKTFSEQVKVLDNGSLQPLNSTLRDGGKVSRGFGDNVATLAKRALLTIPIWLALRGAILGLFKVFTDGFKNLVAFDLALQKIKRNLQGTPEEIARSMQNIRTEITATSIVLGISTEKIAEAVKKFASLGFSVEESLAGAIGASKLSVVLFGDAAETADSFARALNLLIDRSDGAANATEQMNKLFAQTAELEKTNQFEIKEVNESLKNSAGAFKSLGVSGQEALSLLASLGTNLLEGARGGTLISSALQQMVSNLDKVSGVLGISVNPQIESTTEIFIKILDAINEIGKTDIEAQTKAINEIFGGVKGAKPVRALISDLERFKKNLKITGDINTFNKSVSDVTDTLSKQTERFTNLNKEIGKAFITGLVGGSDFKDSLKEINNLLENSIGKAKEFGETLSLISRSSANPILGLLISVEDAKKKIADLKSGILNLATAGLRGGLDTKQLSQVLDKLKFLAKEGLIEVAPQLLDNLSKQLETQINNDLKNKEIKVQANANATVKFNDISLLTTKEEQAIRKLIVDDQLEQLKANGATTSELLRQESILNRQLGIFEDETTILERQLKTQQSLTAERRLQNKLGSDSIKLFEIAQTSGTGIAQQIGDVLAGNIDFASFIRRGGEAVEIFKKEFDDVFKNQQAQAFFRGDTVPGGNGLRGGSNIAIQEEQIRRALTSFNPQAQLALNQAQNQIPTIRNDIQASIEMNINVQGLSFREAIVRMKDEMSKEILNPQSELGKALDERTQQF